MRAELKLFFADCTGTESNCSYPHEAVISDEGSLRGAVGRDYVCVAYKNGHRANANFLFSNCLGMDCDNDHSEKPEDWIAPDHIREYFPDVTFAAHYSRHNMLSKRGKAPRPKFHVLFLINEMRDSAAYADLKKRVNAIFPYFDTKALDAARFFFGTKDPDVAFYPGTLTLNECLDMYYPDADDFMNATASSGAIPEGSRNNTMSRFAGRVLKRFGDTEEAYAAFMERAARCDPPLEDGELSVIWKSAQGFYERIRQQDGYVPPEVYNAETFLYQPEDYSDVGQARMLAEIFGDALRYSPATDYLCYNGTYWQESKPGSQAVAHELTDLQLDEASCAVARTWKVLEGNGVAEILATASKKKAESLLDQEQAAAYDAYTSAVTYKAFVMERRESKNIAYTLKEARPMLQISPVDLDANCYLLCTPDATYDLRLGLAGAREHHADDFMTKMTALSPGATGANIWRDALNTFFCGDQALIEYVQRVAGLACIGQVFIEALIIAYGDGRNGKSTFWNVLSRVLGLYSGNISADALTVGCRRNIKPELAEAKGKRLLIAAELEEGTRLNTSTVKQLCSTDEVFAEKKYKDPFSYLPSHTLVLYTNHLPRVGATDAGIWRRLIVIPFNAKIEGGSDIKNYAEYLYRNAGESVLAWMIEGARQAIELDFQIPLPSCVQQAITAYRGENDWLGHFLDERCEVGDGYQAKSGELYTAYRAYCTEVYEYTRSTTDFYTSLDNEGFARQKTRMGIIVKGLRLKTTEEFEDFLK